LVVVYLGPNNCRKTLSVITLSNFICKWNRLTWQVNNRLHLIIEGRITRSHIVASGVESARFYGGRPVLSVTLRSLNHSVDGPLSRVSEGHRGDVLRRRRPDRRCPHEPVYERWNYVLTKEVLNWADEIANINILRWNFSYHHYRSQYLC